MTDGEDLLTIIRWILKN